jgi:prepilin-type processing-associated H-X9-DG protein
MQTEAWEKVCESNLRWLTIGALEPVVQNRRIQLTTSFKTTIAAAIKRSVVSSEREFDPEHFFHCPADTNGEVSYSFNAQLEGMNQQDIDKLEHPRRTVLLYEGENGRLNFRHNGQAHVSFTDGSTQLVDREQAQSLHWK